VLAALLLQELGFKPIKRGTRVTLTPADNERLLKWQRKHLRLTWCQCASPWLIEHEVILMTRPPLNSAGNTTHSSYTTIREARSALRLAVEQT
jgi:hypothetical protein